MSWEGEIPERGCMGRARLQGFGRGARSLRLGVLPREDKITGGGGKTSGTLGSSVDLQSETFVIFVTCFLK